VNCIQAQAMLAAYRELRNSETDTTDLEVHLEQCASCRQALANYNLVGEHIRSLPAIEPPPDTYAKLMNALAIEQIHYMQWAPPGTHRTPEFLKPYLQEHAQHERTTDPLVAFATAKTGPLPMTQTPRQRRRRSQVSHFAVIGLAAAFLMLVMMSGITTLLILTRGNPRPVAIRVGGNNAIGQLADVARLSYTTSTPYQHVVSAVADRANIYYTAYGDGANDGWMLEQLDRKIRLSSPLLSTASTSPLIVLGSSHDWLVWLQMDPLKPINDHRSLSNREPLVLTRTWSLHYLSLIAPGGPMTLTSGTFNQSASPDWVYSPVQGVWFIQDTLLVASIDENGISHISSYQLDITGPTTLTEIATASPDHVFTSPTATSDGSEIYWSDEWRSGDGILYSNIWTQQVQPVPNPAHGPWVANTQTITVKQLFLADGASFHPQIVDDKLFLLRTAAALDAMQDTSDMSPTSTPSATATPTTQPYTPTTSWADPTVYGTPFDASVRGMLFMLPLDDPTIAPQMQEITSGQAWSPQAGTNFVLWQSDRGYEMYDVVTESPVSIGTVLNGANFLAVNGGTTVWTIDGSTSTTNGTTPTATLMVFNWPN
jgi:hypothetical protein